MKIICAVILCVAALAAPAFAQEKPADTNMQILLENSDWNSFGAVMSTGDQRTRLDGLLRACTQERTNANEF